MLNFIANFIAIVFFTVFIAATIIYCYAAFTEKPRSEDEPRS